MSALEALRTSLPEAAKDVKLNLQSVLATSALSEAQRWGVAVAAAYASRQPDVTRAVLEAARANASPEVIEDARAAAALMAMNNVYYRFRHIVGKPSYATKPARLRMNRLAQPATDKVSLELFSLAVSAINACEACVIAHERAALEGGLTEDHVHDAVRIAAVVHAAAVSAEIAELDRAGVPGDATAR